jgi:hypothetical protein
VTVLAFFLLIGFVFWITSLHDRPEYVPSPEKQKVAHPDVDIVLGGAIRPQPGVASHMERTDLP